MKFNSKEIDLFSYYEIPIFDRILDNINTAKENGKSYASILIEPCDKDVINSLRSHNYIVEEKKFDDHIGLEISW
jgi:hypothetical protein